MEVTQLPIHKRIKKAMDEFNKSEFKFDSKSIRRTMKPSQERLDYINDLSFKYEVQSKTLLKVILCTK